MKIQTFDYSALIIQENTCCQIDDFRVQIELHLGQLADVHYFQVTLHHINEEAGLRKPGLLRVGSIDGGLSRELQLRQTLGSYKMVSELLAAVTEYLVCISSHSPLLQEKIEDTPNFCQAENYIESSFEVESKLEQEAEYLEEIVFEEEIVSESVGKKLILLSYLPEDGETLASWLTEENSLETSLLLASQVCQFFRYVYQREWCFVQIFPKFIQMGTPVQFFDLTGVYPVGKQLNSAFLADYCAPEIAYDSSCIINEQMSTYTVGSLLYETIHHQLPPQGNIGELDIKPIPRIYQILKICLSPIAEERFLLPQLLSLLVEIRSSMRTPNIKWEVASNSTVGLSTSRLQNEDNYGVRQQYFSNSEPLILGVVADGMGGMAQGEVASKLAVETVIEAPVPAGLSNLDRRAEWLIYLVQQANESVASNVRDGGTTLSLVMALGRELMIAHIGDSRIFLLRKKQICQLSEDHSMVAMLVASGQITYEESLEHPDRNLLTKSLGSKRKLSEGYVQDLSRFGTGLSMLLEDEDILILCSDGVWDLVPANELAEIFVDHYILQSAVDSTIEKVLSRGAHDNATILALKYCHKNSSFG
jgi:PPM family protein phosphatase